MACRKVDFAFFAFKLVMDSGRYVGVGIAVPILHKTYSSISA